MAGPPFERYPGPPPGRGDVYRVISPYRDALAWVSNSGKLALVRFMVREGGGWRTLVDEGIRAGDGPTIWRLMQRDPVELVFQAGAMTAFVSVSTDGCQVSVAGATLPEDCDLGIEPGPWLTIAAAVDEP